jgi:FKBP-type peptidyl-prolyl cis-trans isomerase
MHFTTGLIYQVLRLGERGRHPGPRDQVRAAYRAWGEDGRLLDDTGGRVTLSVGELPPGLAEAMQVMTPGEWGRAWVPPHLAGPGPSAGRRSTTLSWPASLGRSRRARSR